MEKSYRLLQQLMLKRTSRRSIVTATTVGSAEKQGVEIKHPSFEGRDNNFPCVTR